MFSLLREECKSNSTDDLTVVQKFNEYFGHNNDFIYVKNNPNVFGINHFSGKIKYDGTKLLSKCKDFISKNMIECLQKSDDFFIADLFSFLPLPNGSFSK